ncbi:hypothetical protein BsWGS_12472 [Bradybaena similaris]
MVDIYCPVCLATCDPAIETVSALTCGHVAHERCIIAWWGDKVWATCPCCRSGVFRLHTRRIFLEVKPSTLVADLQDEIKHLKEQNTVLMKEIADLKEEKTTATKVHDDLMAELRKLQTEQNTVLMKEIADLKEEKTTATKVHDDLMAELRKLQTPKGGATRLKRGTKRSYNSISEHAAPSSPAI